MALLCTLDGSTHTRWLYSARYIGCATFLILDDKNDVTSDGPATPFTRIWCAFEESININDLHLPLDIATHSMHKAELLTVCTGLNVHCSHALLG